MGLPPPPPPPKLVLYIHVYTLAIESLVHNTYMYILYAAYIENYAQSMLQIRTLHKRTSVAYLM